MSDTYDSNDQDDEDVQRETPQQLREAAERGKKAAEERDQALRKLAFAEANVDFKSPAGQMFVRGYDGELTEEAISEAAKQIPGVLKGEAPAVQPEQQQQLSPEEMQQTAQRGDLAGDSAGAGVDPGVDPSTAGLDAFHKDLSEGRGREKASAAYFDSMMSAAANGDPRAIVPERKGNG